MKIKIIEIIGRNYEIQIQSQFDFLFIFSNRTIDIEKKGDEEQKKK